MNRKPTAIKTIRTFCTPAALAVALAAAPRSAEAAGLCVCNICVGSGDTMTISGGLNADCVLVDTGGTIEIEASSTLTLTGPGPSSVDGDLVLRGSDSKLKFTGLDHTVTGSGKIKGRDDEAQIEIAPGVTFTGDVKIVGHLQITGAGSFVNDGCVTADAPAGALDLAVTGTIDDAAGACWQVVGQDATLRFLTKPARLDGDFTVGEGTLRAGRDAPVDDIDVVTTGDLTHTGGKIVAGVDDSFTFNGTCPAVPSPETTARAQDNSP